MNVTILNESQQSKLIESIDQNRDFFSKIIQRYPEVEIFQDFLFNSIYQIGNPKITIESLRYGAGVSLPNRVVISNNTLNYPLTNFLFNLFHELAHQHQFRKYGYEKMIELYNENVSLEHAAKLMFDIEVVADEFATRKLREMVRKGLLQPNINIPTGNYKTTPKETFLRIIGMVRDMLKELEYETPEELGEKLYNLIKVGVDQ